MRYNRWILPFVVYCVLCTITFVESKKVKEERDIEEKSKISSRQEQRRKGKDLIDDSVDRTSREKMTTYNSPKRDKLKGKKKYSFQNSNSNESGENMRDKKYYKRKYKKEEYSDFNEKDKTNFRRREEYKDPHSSEEFVEKGKKLKTPRYINRNKDNNEDSSKGFQKRSVSNEKLVKHPGNEESKIHGVKEKKIKRPQEDSNNFKHSLQTKLVQNEFNVSNAEEEHNTSVTDNTQSKSGYCNNYIVQVNGCNEEADTTDNLNEETEEEQALGPKKMKYSIKFAHEKMSKKQRNKDAENILKLHRKAESNYNNAKILKKTVSFRDTEEESSEEVLPKRRLHLYEDEEV